VTRAVDDNLKISKKNRWWVIQLEWWELLRLSAYDRSN